MRRLSEKKIDLIDSRLEEVVGLLRNLSTHVSAPGNTHDDVPVPYRVLLEFSSPMAISKEL